MKKSSHHFGLWLAAALIVASPLLAVAQSEEPVDAQVEGSQTFDKALDYGMCAVSLVAATSGWGVALAVLSCGKAMNVWWTE